LTERLRLRRINVSDETKDALAEAVELEGTVLALEQRLTAGPDEPETYVDASEDGVLFAAIESYAKNRQARIVALANDLLDAKDGAR
jgi:hypothetical protein